MDLINNTVNLKLFAYIGVMCIAVVIAFIIWAISEWVKEKIRQTRINYRIKHRFDGKPVAKCWCRDCRAYINKTKLCSLCNRYKADNGFCDEADPTWKRMEEKNGD